MANTNTPIPTLHKSIKERIYDEIEYSDERIKALTTEQKYQAERAVEHFSRGDFNGINWLGQGIAEIQAEIKNVKHYRYGLEKAYEIFKGR